jgi:hypothetical protein
VFGPGTWSTSLSQAMGDSRVAPDAPTVDRRAAPNNDDTRCCARIRRRRQDAARLET